MRVLIAPQEFKGSLTAIQAASAIAEGLSRALPEAQLDLAPMADGGPGTVDALLAAGGGRRQVERVQDPLGRPVEAAWALLESGTAVVEMAAASGLVLLRPGERDPRRASTFGTGQLLARALAAEPRRLIVGLGGSATVDGGAGMAQALGVRLLDPQGRDLPAPAGGADLSRLQRIDASGMDPPVRRWMQGREGAVLAATDVTNPLCGPQGAAAVYGPQKGATPQVVRELDGALAHCAGIIERDLGVAVADLPGAGAAGGLGAGLVAFLGAELRPGAPLVAEAVGLEARIARADLAVTGEGRLDAQTAYGKTVWVVARMAKRAGKPVLALVGSLAASGKALKAMGIDAARATSERGATEEELRRAAESLSALAERVGRGLAGGDRRGLITTS